MFFHRTIHKLQSQLVTFPLHLELKVQVYILKTAVNTLLTLKVLV